MLLYICIPCHNGCACSLTVFCVSRQRLFIYLSLSYGFRFAKTCSLFCFQPHSGSMNARVHLFLHKNTFYISQPGQFISLISNIHCFLLFSPFSSSRCLSFCKCLKLHANSQLCVESLAYDTMQHQHTLTQRTSQLSSSNQLNLVQPHYNTIATYNHSFSVCYILGT